MKNLPIQLKILIGIIIFVPIFLFISFIYNSSTELYNNSKKLTLEYSKLVNTQITNYDGYYLAFIDKQTNANINKETFIEVTNIIMSNRKDGQNLAWKWNTENQQIPFQEFSDFYKELSYFISERYKDNMYIEQAKQEIVQKHNYLITKYPNNILNKWLLLPELEYKFGYVSKETLDKFNN